MAITQSKNMSAGPSLVPYADMSLDGPEIGTLVAVVDRAKNLPNRKTMGKQDPYCAMRLGKEAKKTETDRRGGQTPRWDQELRFTVHDSPDYYKLKCSVFNDDKKTDMIGEAWLDLREVIVLGGGQNDLWHQLNFKGKYAGDIRIELTYYDTRTNLELEASKQRQRGKAFGSETASNASSSRSLGPREIKRRPLPPGPTHSAPAELPQPLRIQRQLPPQPNVLQPMQQPHTPSNDAAPYASFPQKHWASHQDVNDYAFGHNSSPYNAHIDEEEQFRQQEFQDSYSTNEKYQENGYLDSLQSYTVEPRPVMPHSYSEPQAGKHAHSSPIPLSYAQSSSPYGAPASSPPVHQSPPSLPEIPPRTNRMSASPTKYATHRDSPLRQSVSQHDVPPPSLLHSTAYDDLDAPPPPPPSHRNSLPRPSSSAQNTPLNVEQFRRLPQPPPNIGDRSPLQMIEQQYHTQPHQAQRTPERRQARDPHSSQARIDRQPTVADTLEDAPAGEFPAPHQLSQNYGVDFMTQPVEQDHQGRYIRRNSGLDDSPYRLPPQRSQTFDSADVFDERNTYRSEPQVVRPRAVSPDEGHSVPRKSISPHRQARNDQSRMSGIPFGPDSYDVLKPASDLVPDYFSTPVDSQEVARQKEVDKLRGQGPIIGNDGRVIDPSDHLPSDTWAPEPERKTRKPEHVIRIRTKDDARSSRVGSSPLPKKPTSDSNSPHQPSPPSANSPYAPTFDQMPPPSTEPRRNRLQKQMPQRPLPIQPFPHPQSSPASIPQLHDFHRQTPPRNSMPSSPMSGQQQRHVMFDTPPSGPPSRPPLSEYQVPTTNNYSPRGSYYPPPQNPPTPTKMPQRRQSYGHGGYEDPLAAELSMIDIGPSRGGRTALRSSRAYGGY